MSDSDSPSPAPSRRPTLRLLLVFLFISIGILFLGRDRIRARWWAHKLAEMEMAYTESADASAVQSAAAHRQYYFALLMGAGASAEGAVNSLAKHESATVRSLAIPLLAALPDEAGLPRLADMVLDADRDIRESAALSIAFGQTRLGTACLVDIAKRERPEAAAAAMLALGRDRDPRANAALLDAIKSHPSPLVRAQAIESTAGKIMDAGSLALPEGIGLDPVLLMVETLGDTAEFDARLGLEREMAAVAAFAASQGHGLAEFEDGNGPRTVGSIARAWLTRLTGQDVTTTPEGAEAEALSAMCWESIRRRQAATVQKPQSTTRESSDITTGPPS